MAIYGHIESTVNTLDAVPHDFQIITVCGNNAEAKARIDAMRTKKRILNFGFTDKVDLLMDASDCIITKPGGLTSSAALARLYSFGGKTPNSFRWFAMCCALIPLSFS